ncbi:DUF6153 family protein [Streptomyces sp. NBC_01803]|uniref:DUF6153 family protein n=1 Tax=Streptomyces sp. NBC_01803 TaxID=2975946 RepID=UPI002DDC211E|nr:DUF6153 family protein [Streptomyces sp. NBC_01803]WSA43019.1 DUF6153 family protein [Streptomyces sp. NBC_01803]
MSSQRPSAASPVRAGAGPTLMALAVLIGLMAMHGLAPGTATPYAPSGTEHAMASAAATGAQPDVEHAHPGQGGHAEHADAECAAGGVASAPPLSPPPLAVLPPGTASPPLTRSFVDEPGGGRAPPSLSELQLLRI